MIYLFIKHIRKNYSLITEDWVGLGYKDEEKPKKDSEQLRKKKKSPLLQLYTLMHIHE